MRVLGIMGIGLVAIIVLVGLWWVLRYLLLKIGVGEFNAGDLSGLILVVLTLLFAAAMIITSEEESRARCGPGTKEVVERIWTGKVYVTDYVCVVDMDAVQR